MLKKGGLFLGIIFISLLLIRFTNVPHEKTAVIYEVNDERYWIILDHGDQLESKISNKDIQVIEEWGFNYCENTAKKNLLSYHNDFKIYVDQEGIVFLNLKTNKQKLIYSNEMIQQAEEHHLIGGTVSEDIVYILNTKQEESETAQRIQPRESYSISMFQLSDLFNTTQL